MTGKVIENWKQKIRNMKKEDYIVLLLAGVLLLIISLPTEREKAAKNGDDQARKEEERKGGGITDFWEEKAENAVSETGDAAGEAGSLNYSSTYDMDLYVAGLEKRAAEIISSMEGAGKVNVMITVSDMGVEMLEHNKETSANSLEETDSAGGNRKNTENSLREEVVYKRDSNGNELPYVVQRKLPEVTGVVVTAEGAGNARVKENIIGAVSVLFNLNEHRIKVIRMKS